ncbi:hypothetical protein EMIT0P395_230045 [Pseudomonas sp. IT-P395]
MGASLVANEVDQSTLQRLKERFREQARSYIGSLHTTKTCGSWLASDEARSGNTALLDPPLSLASQLPQGFVVN